MNRGKDICKELKAVRRRIADENGIPLEIPECTYHGPCAGTCPRCEWELRQLETALADRLRLGKVATVAGLALGLSLSASAQSEVPKIEIGTPVDSTHQEVAKGCLKGTVIDAKTKEPLPFVNVILKQDDKMVKGATTDFDGMFTIKPVPAGEYTFEVSFVGYKRIVREGIRILPTGFTVCDISLPRDTAAVLQGGVRERTATTIKEEPAISIGGVQQVLLPGTPASQSGDDRPRGHRLMVLDAGEDMPRTTRRTAAVDKQVKISGTVLDEKTKEPLPFVNVSFKQEGKPVAIVQTDFDGLFKVELPVGDYTMEIRSVGYRPYEQQVNVTKKTDLGEILIECTAALLEGIVIESEATPLLEIDPYGNSQHLEIEGVQVNVK